MHVIVYNMNQPQNQFYEPNFGAEGYQKTYGNTYNLYGLIS